MPSGSSPRVVYIQNTQIRDEKYKLRSSKWWFPFQFISLRSKYSLHHFVFKYLLSSRLGSHRFYTLSYAPCLFPCSLFQPPQHPVLKQLYDHMVS